MFEADKKQEGQTEEKTEAVESPSFWEAEDNDAAILEQSLGADPLATPDNEKVEEQPKPFSPEQVAEREEAVEEAKETPEEKPAAEAKPAEEKPAEPAEEKKKGEGWAWRELRRMQREQKEREAAAKPPEKPAEAKPAEEEEILDPIEKAQRDAAEAMEMARKAQERAEQAEKNAEIRAQELALVSEIEREEKAFTAEHPDYEAAMKHVVEARKEQYELMGRLDSDAVTWMQKNLDLVKRHASESGLDPANDDHVVQAARDIAFRVAIHQERQQFIANCKRTGKNVAATLYGLAEKMGYKPATAAAPAPAAPNPQDEAKERVQKAKEAGARREPFEQSLSAMDANHSPAPAKIKSRAELMRMSDDDQDKLIAEMDLKNPHWFETLED